MNTKDVNQALDVAVAISPAMLTALQEWTRLYENKAEWLNGYTRSLNLPAAISGEFARLITLEMGVAITGSARADFLAEQIKPLLQNIRLVLEPGCAKGGLMIKPISDGKTLTIDIVQADSFFPITFSSLGDITACVFIDQRTVGDATFTRLEYHSLTNEGVQIINKAYRSTTEKDSAEGELGQPIPLAECPIEAWQSLEESATVKGAKQPLYGYFKFPVANNKDSLSPLGISCFDRGIEQIKEADVQMSDILWEYESGKRAIDVDELAFEVDTATGIRNLPDKRLYRTYKRSGDKEDLFEAWSPELRDAGYFAGLDGILRRLEFNVSFAYGTLSNPQTVEKTAEEIKTSKQRSYATVADAQKALGYCLDHVIYAMNALATAYKLAPKGKYEAAYKWDDSLITDYDGQHSKDLMEVGIGVMSKLEFRMRNHKETKEKAKEMLALAAAEQPDDLGEGESEGDEGS